MLADCLRKLQCAIRIIALPIQGQWETRPQCDIKFFATITDKRFESSLPFVLAGVADSYGLHLLIIFMRDRYLQITIAILVVYQ